MSYFLNLFFVQKSMKSVTVFIQKISNRIAFSIFYIKREDLCDYDVNVDALTSVPDAEAHERKKKLFVT